MGHPRRTAVALVGLADVANTFGEHGQATQLALESLELTEEYDAEVLMGETLNTLGDAACGLGDFHQAEECYHRALEIAVATPDAFLAPALVLVGIASLLAAKGRGERALELLTLVLHHPASWQPTRDQAAALAAELAAELPPEAVEAAQERGRTRDLETTVAELLDA